MRRLALEESLRLELVRIESESVFRGDRGTESSITKSIRFAFFAPSDFIFSLLLAASSAFSFELVGESSPPSCTLDEDSDPFCPGDEDDVLSDIVQEGKKKS